MAHDVFISYSTKDKAAADAACNVLERNGVRVWMAPRDILPGVGWAESLIGAINSARVMVLVYSSNANKSPQIEREVERAINKGLPVVPFRVEDVAPSATLEYFISETHWLDAFTPPLDGHIRQLADATQRGTCRDDELLRPRAGGCGERAGGSNQHACHTAECIQGESLHGRSESGGIGPVWGRVPFRSLTERQGESPNRC